MSFNITSSDNVAVGKALWQAINEQNVAVGFGRSIIEIQTAIPQLVKFNVL